jgi:hypothetical protein
MEARSETSGVSGTVTTPRIGRSRSKVMRSSTETNAAARMTVTTPRENCQVEAETAEADGGPNDLDHKDGVRDSVVEGRDAHGLLVDHLVEGLDVEPGRALGGRTGERLATERRDSTDDSSAAAARD